MRLDPETTPDPKRNPDTTQSVHHASRGILPKGSSKQTEDEIMKILEQTQIPLGKKITEEDLAKAKEGQLEIFRKIKNIRPIKSVRFYQIFWILDPNTPEPLNSFDKVENLEKLTYLFVLKNVSKSKIKKVIIDKVVMSCAANEWVFTPHESKNHITKVILPDESINFTINLYWDKEEKDMTYAINSFMVNLCIKINIITIGNYEQKEIIELGIWTGNMDEPSYELV